MIEEELLEAWIALTMLVRGNRVLSTLSYNEMVVLRLLKEEDGLTAEYIRSVMHLHKSQMASLVTMLEKKDLIERKKDEQDKRKLLIFLKHRDTYKVEHEKIKDIMKVLVDGLGEKKAKELTELMKESEQILSEGNTKW